jgi:glyoxylase-like metal-dependent hydrolase (beta-lactamase superfamily II)
MKNANLNYQQYTVGHLESNAYILYSRDSGRCFIIDPGDEAQRLTTFINEKKLSPAGIISTHGHVDHCGAVKELKKTFDIPFMIHRDDEPILHSPLNRGFAPGLNVPLPPPPDRLLQDGDIIETEGIEIEVIHTPGHSPGSISLDVGGLLFTGDTMMQGGVGRTDLDYGDFNDLRKSLDKLRDYPPETVLLPGHGGESTLAVELRLNPYL